MNDPTSFAPSGSRSVVAEDASGSRLASLEAIKAFALLWICLVHWTEHVIGPWYISNPSNDWPPLAEGIAQLTPISGFGAWDVPLTLLLALGEREIRAFSYF
jgi:hypothetical protein